MKRLPHSLVALVGAMCFTLVAGCGAPSSTPDAGSGGTGGECNRDDECPDVNLFECSKTTFRCEPKCQTREDCTAAKRGPYALAYCNGPRACECDEQRCVAALCSTDSDCGDLVCRNGECVAAPTATEVASCQITPDYVVARAGAKVKLWVSGWDAAKRPVVLKDGAAWSALSAVVAGSGSGLSAEFTVAAASAPGPVEAVQATMGSASCKAKVLVVPEPGVNEVNVAVIDELSGRPIEGVRVIATSPASGQTIGDVALTSATGVARLAVPGETAIAISAFHANYAYLTLASYPLPGASRVVSLVLRRNQLSTYGGYKANPGFSGVPGTPNVHAGLVGLSIAGSITDLSFAQIVGPSYEREVKLGSYDLGKVGLPAGVFLGYQTEAIKPDVAAQGLAGVCFDDSGAPDEAKIASGACGTRTAWALSGDVALGEIPLDAFREGESPQVSELLGKIIPLFKKFNSSVVRDVRFDLKPTPGGFLPDGGFEDQVFTDTQHFTSLTHEFAQVPLGFAFAAESPELPKYRNIYADGVAVLGGAIVRGRGVVPLGLGAGVNAQVDGKTDAQQGLPAGQIAVRMAPTHHGLEGSEYGLLGLALSAANFADPGTGLGASVLFSRVPGNQLSFDPSGARPVKLSGSYLPFPENAKFNFADAPVRGIPGRSFRFVGAAPALGDATVVRVTFTDRGSRRWVVLMDAAQAAGGFTLPRVPGGLADRTFWLGNIDGTRSELNTQLIRLAKDPSASPQAALTFRELVELNDANAENLVSFTTAFSWLDYERPDLAYTTPNASGVTVAAQSTIVVRVDGFRVGSAVEDDGSVRLSFTDAGGAPICGTLPPEGAPSETGELSFKLPAGCSGTNIKATASFVLPDGSPAFAHPKQELTFNIGG